MRQTVLFKDKDGHEYPFELQDAKPPAESFAFMDRKLVASHFATNEVDYNSTSPEEIGLRVSQSDWRRGFADEYYEDERKYAHSVNCDARFKGRVILAPKKQTAVSFGNAYVWDGFELWDDANNLTNWVETLFGAGTVLSRDTASKRSGTYCAKLFTTANGGDLKIVRTFTWNAGYQSKSVTASVYCKLDTLTSCAVKIGINDGVTDTWSSALGTAGAYTALSVTKTMAANATALIVTIWMASTTDADRNLYVDDFNISSNATTGIFAATTPLKLMDFGTTLVAAVGKTLYTTTDGASITAPYGFENDITDICVFDNYLHILHGAAVVPHYTSDLTTFTLSGAYGGVTANYTTTKNTAGGATFYTASDTTIEVTDSSVFTAGEYAVWDAGLDTEEYIETDSITDGDTIVAVRARLGSTAYGHESGSTIRKISALAGAVYMANVGNKHAMIADTTGQIRISDNPLNNGTAWSTAYTLDNDDRTITDLVDDPNGNYLILKQDGPYYLDEDVTPLLIQEAQSDVSTTETYEGHVWQGRAYFPGGVNKLRVYDLADDIYEDISIVGFAPGDEDMDAEVTAITSDADYLYVALDNGTEVEILAGRYETIAGTTSWVWHPIWEKTSNDIVSMCVSSVSGSKRLYALTDTYTDGVLVFTLPQSYSDVLLESSYEFETTGTFVTPWFETEFFEQDKYWANLKVSAMNFSGYTSIQVHYQIEGQGEWDDTNDWTELGFCDASELFSYTASPRALDYPPQQVTSFDINASARAIRFKFTLKTALDASTTDELSPVLLRYGVFARVEKSIGGKAMPDELIVMTLSLHDDPFMRNGTQIQYPVGDQIQDLRSLRRASEALTLIGPDRIERKVKFYPGEFQCSLDSDYEGSSPAFVAKMALEEV